MPAAKRERPRTLKEIKVGDYCLVLVRRWPGRRFRVDVVERDRAPVMRYSTDRKTARHQAAVEIRRLRRTGRCR